MEKVGAYREYALECRRLAKQMKDPGNVDQLRQIAKAWDDLAADRERRLESVALFPTGRTRMGSLDTVHIEPAR